MLNRKVLLFITIALFSTLYLYGAKQQLSINDDLARTDQSAYMNYARKLSITNYTYTGDRNRMPLYPLLQSFLYEPSMTDEVYFETGKQFNIALSFVLLIAAAFLVDRYFSSFTSFNIILITAFTVFVFKAAYFQAELLFYFLNFCLFLLYWQHFRKTSVTLSILTGIVAGLAHLTKASVLPGLLVFLFVFSLHIIWTHLRGKTEENILFFKQSIYSQIILLILVSFMFLVTIFPYIQTSKRVFGSYFYNVNSTFYIWYDSWEEAKQGTRAHGDRVGWPDMPEDEIPSLSKYLREHTFRQIVRRLVNGGQQILENVINSYGYHKYIILMILALLLSGLKYRNRAIKEVRANPILILFLLSYFTIYFLLYFWYAPIADGNRLILAMFLPMLFTLFYGFKTLIHGKQIRLSGFSVHVEVFSNFLLASILIVDIYLILSGRIFTMYGGS